MRQRGITQTRLALDFSNTLYRGFYSLRNLTSDGFPTGGAYGFVTQITQHINMYKPSHIVVCKDSPPYIRKVMHPEYKADRKPIDADVYAQITQNSAWASKIIEAMGLQVIKQPGYEADDFLAAYAARYASKRRTRTILLVNDSDLYQCFTKRNNVFLSVKSRLYGIRDFQKEYEFPIDRWPLFVSLTGSHNAVKGIRGIGPVTAKKAMLDDCFYKELYDKHHEIIERNLQLVVLPLPVRVPVLPVFEKQEYDEKKLIEVLSEIDIVPTAQILDAMYEYHRS